MSDAVTNTQVEDVLSSIRRLVGENKRPNPLSETESTTDRLVLTPQLRVSEHDVLMLAPEQEVRSDESWLEYEEPPLDDREPFALGEDEETTEEAVQFVHRTEEDDQERHPPKVAETTVDDSTVEAFFAQSSSAVLSEKIAALESAIDQASDFYEPEGDEEDDFGVGQSSLQNWDNDIEFDEASTLAEPKQQYSDEYVDDDTTDEEIVDEIGLRELVADIVRSELRGEVVSQIVRAELQGELGERITRNVRKMVRREIQRAMTTYEID